MRLAVNIDHIATIREARKAREPEPVAAAIIAELAGAQGITVHLRGDRRHIKERDVELLRQVVSTKLNIEMAATAEMTGIAARDQARPGDAGARAAARADDAGRSRRRGATGRRSATAVAALRAAGIRVSIFIDPDEAQVRASREAGADAIEINTGQLRGRAPADRPARLAAVRAAAAGRRARGPRGARRPRPHLREHPARSRRSRTSSSSTSATASSRARRWSASTSPCAR